MGFVAICTIILLSSASLSAEQPIKGGSKITLIFRGAKVMAQLAVEGIRELKLKLAMFLR